MERSKGAGCNVFLSLWPFIATDEASLPPNSESSPSCPRGPPPLCLFALRAGASTEPTHRESPFSALFPAEYPRQHADATRRQSTRFTDYRPRRRIGSARVHRARRLTHNPPSSRHHSRRRSTQQHNPPHDMRATRIYAPSQPCAIRIPWLRR